MCNLFFNDFVDLMIDVFGVVQVVGEEVQVVFWVQVDCLVVDMDLVSCEEYDVVKVLFVDVYDQIVVLEVWLEKFEKVKKFVML